jgi:uncharacterized membrane protein YozB (DUF420 family)
MNVNALPALNAALNGTAAALLVWGFALIRRGKRESHRKVMLSAFATSLLFLICYTVYHWHAGSVRYQRTGWMRTVYLLILLSHTLLAALLPPLACLTLFRAWKGRWEAHRRLARWTLPIWLYVSLTGVAVYVMLYRL